jgi:hypothetical protein
VDVSLRGVCAVVFIVMRGTSLYGRLEEEIVAAESICVVMFMFRTRGSMVCDRRKKKLMKNRNRQL